MLDELGSVQWPCNEKAPEGTPIMHIDGFVRGKGKFIRTEYVRDRREDRAALPAAADHRAHPVAVQCRRADRRTDNVVWHDEDRLEIHPHDAENRGIRDGDWVRLASRAGETTLRALITDRVAPGVVYTTFHHPDTQANVITTDYLGLGDQLPGIQGDGRAGGAVQRPDRSGRASMIEQARAEPAHRKAGWRRRSSLHAPPPLSPRPQIHPPRRAAPARHGGRRNRMVPEETPVAFSFAGTTHAVMMASPADFEDFALGFSLTEGIIDAPDEIEAIEVEDHGAGIDIQIRLKDQANTRFQARRRRLAGPVGCGLCGIESIEEAMRSVDNVERVGAHAFAPPTSCSR